MKLEKALTEITPLPWRENPANGELIGSDGELLGMVVDNPDNGTQSLGEETSDFNAAYLTHAANVLPELVEDAEKLVQELKISADYSDKMSVMSKTQQAINAFLKSLAQAEEVKVSGD